MQTSFWYPWLCIDDLNDILSPSNKLGGAPPDLGNLEVENRVCFDCGPHRVESSSYTFTWTNKRTFPNTVEEHLDYALMNVAWDDLWHVSLVSHLVRYHSDHSPIVLHCGARRANIKRHRTRLFRFEELGLQSGVECTEIVTEAWCEPNQGLIGKIEGLGQVLDSWGKAKYGDLPKR